jgi:hypothetical protein
VGVGLEVDPVMLPQRKRRRRRPRPNPRCWGLTGGGEARPAACEWGVAVEVRRQHGEFVSERGRDSNGGRILSGMCCPLLCSPATARSLFVRLTSHQPALFSLRTNQPTVLFSHNEPASAISHQPNEQAVGCLPFILPGWFWNQNCKNRSKQMH